MNGDLEKTLDELGHEYRAVVARLRASRELVPSARVGAFAASPLVPVPGKAGLVPGAWRPAATFFRRFGYVAAASLLVALGLSVFLQDATHSPRAPYAGAKVYTVAYAPDEEALETIVASQRADGSWSNDFLTQQNAAALRASPDARMRVAYRRAVRYLRSKGLAPLTDAELKARGDRAAKMLADV